MPTRTTTTHINVNISTTSPGGGALERRGSLRGAPPPTRPALRPTLGAETPPLPARSAAPALPPRQPVGAAAAAAAPPPSAAAAEEKTAPADGADPSAANNGGVSSIWYEYGCV